MRTSALSGAAVALVLAIGPFAPAAMAATAASATPGVSTFADRCHETHFYDGRWHRMRHLICEHGDGNHEVDPYRGRGDRDHDGNRGHDMENRDMGNRGMGDREAGNRDTGNKGHDMGDGAAHSDPGTSSHEPVRPHP